MLGKLRSLISRYPRDAGVHPRALRHLPVLADPADTSAPVVAQSVPDKFYFLLFAALRTHLFARKPRSGELVVVKGISGAVGAGWLPDLKRSFALAWLTTQPWVRASKGLFQQVAYRNAALRPPWQKWAERARAKRIWEQLRTAQGSLKLAIDGIEVGDLLIDTYLRFKPSPEFDIHDPFMLRLIEQALGDVRRARQYFNHRRPSIYLTSYSTYLEHGVPVRAALQAGVPVWSFGNLNQFGKQLSLTDSFHTSDFSNYRAGFDALTDPEARLRQADAQLSLRLSGGIDAATSYMRQSAYGKSAADLPSDLAGSTVVFMHDFYDSPHVYPDLVFDDFWQWICVTIDALQQAGQRFFLKPHPNQIGLSDLAVARLRAQYPDAPWLSVGINSVQLANAGIARGVTAYGTVAHELAYLGIPSIGCARHPHHTYDFCQTARTRAEYVALLKSTEPSRLSTEELRKQALSFYYMHNLHGTDTALASKAAFVELWKACNLGAPVEAQILEKLQALIRSPGFGDLIREMERSAQRRC